MECKGCNEGIKMCHHRPCFGTPEEFEKIIDAGFAHKLRIDYWCGRPDNDLEELDDYLGETITNYIKKNPNPHKEDVYMLTGGTSNDINYVASLWPTGTCKFLENDLCTLHDLGLKPEQGREACCKDSENLAKNNLHYANLWATEKGKQVIEKFKAIIYKKESEK